MFIHNLSMENFKAVKQSSFNFHKGIICFTGDNGEGKSTVLHAIIMLLFNMYDGNLRDYIRWGETEFRLSIEFSDKGHTYREKLSYSVSKGSIRELTCVDTEEVFSGASAISKLSEIIDPEQARGAIVSMENEQNLVTTTPSQRREYLKKIYSLEFKDELQKIAQDTTDTENDIIKTQSKIDILGATDFPLKEYRESPSKESYEDAKREIETIDVKIRDLLDKQVKIDDIERKLTQAKGNLSSLERQFREASLQIENSESELKQIDEEEHQMSLRDFDKEELETKDRVLKSQTESLENVKTSLRVLEESYSISRIPMDPDRTTLTKLREELTSLQTQLRTTEKNLGFMREGKCPLCGKEVTEEELRKEEEAKTQLTRDISDLTRKVSEEESSIRSTEDRIREAREKERKYLSEKNHLEQTLNTTLQKQKSEIERITSDFEHERKVHSLKLETLSNKRVSCNNSISVLSQTLESVSKQESIIKDQIEDLNRDLSSIEDPKPIIALYEKDKETPRAIIKEYEDCESYNNAARVFNEEMEKKSKERDTQLEELSVELNTLNSRKTKLIIAKGIVQKEFPSFVISKMIETLSMYVNEFLSKVYPKYQISIEESKNSLNFLYGDFKSDVKGASGFEKSVFSLAYMYALGKIQNYGLLICDEGDSAASDANATKFYETLGRSLDWIDQIMCITHKEEVKDLLRSDYHAQVFVVQNGEYEEE